MVECTGLENRRTERYRGFESLLLCIEKRTMSMSKNKIISEIVRIDYIITNAVINGHKPTNGDKYSGMRGTLKYLRNLL